MAQKFTDYTSSSRRWSMFSSRKLSMTIVVNKDDNFSRGLLLIDCFDHLPSQYERNVNVESETAWNDSTIVNVQRLTTMKMKHELFLSINEDQWGDNSSVIVEKMRGRRCLRDSLSYECVSDSYTSKDEQRTRYSTDITREAQIIRISMSHHHFCLVLLVSLMDFLSQRGARKF